MGSPLKLYQCRLCLNKTPTRVSIFGGDFPKMLEVLTSIKVHESDGLPKYSCIKCAKEVQMALMVKKRIVKAHKLLLEALKKKKQLLEQTLGSISPNKVTHPQPKQIVTKVVKNKVIQNKPKVVRAVKATTYVEVGESSSIQDSSNNEDECVTKDIKTEKESVFEKSTQEEKKGDLNDKDLQDIIDEVQVQIKSVGFTCETCSLSFSDKASFNLHSLKHKKTKCHICSRLIRSDNIRKHVMLHTAGPSVCSLCGVTCKNIESLRGHIFYQHKHAAQQYVCEECGKGFRIKYKFLLHKKKAHMGLRNFKCLTCGKAFFTNGNLLTHVRMTHEKLRPHVCEYCGTGFSSTYALKTHKRQHTNEKPFVCDYCFEGFRQRVSLRSHLKSKHGIEEAKECFCKVCDKGFATNYALSIHERLHETEKCEICSEAFAGSEYLNNHLKEVHNIKKESETNT